MPSLRIERPDQSPFVYQLSRPVTSIGRARLNQIVLSDPLAPDVAVQIHFNRGRFLAAAVDSSSAVLINGKPARSHQLVHKDRLRIGATEVVFWDDAAAGVRCPRTALEADAVFERLAAVSRRLSGDTSLGELLDALMDGAIGIARADKGFLVLFNGDEPQVRVARNCRRESLGDLVAQMSDSILETVRRTHEPLFVEDVLQNPAYRRAASVDRLGLTSVMCLPLLEHDHLLGLLYVGRHHRTELLDPRSLAPLTVLAAQGALLIRNALLIDELRLDNQRLTERLEGMGLGEVIGECPAMQEVFRQLDRVATVDVPVLLVGEKGTGKELVAREIHRRSARGGGPFESISCSALSEQLLEVELFGCVPGASPGAVAGQPGKLLAASGGTLFLDGITAVPVELQARLARALEERAVTRLGGDRADPMDVRIVSASRGDLEAEIAAGHLREDLRRQLALVRIELPPLRERGDDLLLLARHFLDRSTHELGSLARGFSPEAVQVMRRYPWPGNVGQLEDHVKRAAVLARGALIGVEELDLPVEELRPMVPLAVARERFERDYVREVLALCDGNRSHAARALGMDRRTLYRYLGERTGAEANNKCAEPADANGTRPGR